MFTFQNGQTSMKATDGAKVDGDWLVCGYSENYYNPQLIPGYGIRIYAGNSTATIRPGKTVAIGGYDFHVRLVRGSTAVMDIRPR
ncbi:hypothetical protein [Kribbella deserti]|uniref:Uncharacterized protein n=1 Tax=Kribbella deserti TaxID=1926257 RepID=A0ABV6QFF1_9ACTN